MTNQKRLMSLSATVIMAGAAFLATPAKARAEAMTLCTADQLTACSKFCTSFHKRVAACSDTGCGCG